MSQPLTVDRIEGEVAVVEIGQLLVDIPLSHLPEGVKEGDVLEVVLRDPLVDATATVKRLRARDPGDTEIEL